jgi:hypothetical protein
MQVEHIPPSRLDLGPWACLDLDMGARHCASPVARPWPVIVQPRLYSSV